MSRTRTEGPVVRSGQVAEYYQPPGGAINGPNNQSTYTISSVQKTMTDIVTPQFRRRLKSGEFINNPCSLHVVELDHTGGGSYNRTGGVGNYTYWLVGEGSKFEWMLDHHWHTSPVTNTFTPKGIDVVRDAQLKAIANLDKSPMSVFEDILEIRETLNFLRNPLDSLRNLSRAFSTDVDRLARVYRNNQRKYLWAIQKHRFSFHADPRDVAIAETWLTYRFALSPLVRLCGNLLDEFNLAQDKKKRPDGWITSRGSSSTAQSLAGNVSLSSYAVHRWRKQYKSEARAAISYKVTNPVEGWRFRYGLRDKDLPVGFWNVVPYSFIIDRMFNVSGAIQGLFNLTDPNVVIRGGSVTTRTELITDQDLSYGYQSGWSNSVHSDTRVDKDFRYDRVVWTPSLGNLIPDFNLSGLVSSASSTVDIINLIIQRLK